MYVHNTSRYNISHVRIMLLTKYRCFSIEKFTNKNLSRPSTPFGKQVSRNIMLYSGYMLPTAALNGYVSHISCI